MSTQPKVTPWVITRDKRGEVTYRDSFGRLTKDLGKAKRFPLAVDALASAQEGDVVQLVFPKHPTDKE